jgi:asparagine synthase (glutamine-hydrolysing)
VGIQVEQPFLSPPFISFSRTIPIDDKITGSNDFVRKQILRQVALEIGVPVAAATKPKKALQYGSLIHKHMKRFPRRSTFIE